MIPWEELDRARVPGDANELVLRRRGRDFSIRTAGTELMNSWIHWSEDELARLALEGLVKKDNPGILIGGLGMGYTLAAALKHVPENSRIVVAELVPAVVAWNRDYLGHLAGMPLEDPRVKVEETDVAGVIKKAGGVWDAIILDVDNGPAGLTRRSNNSLYTRAGLKACFWALARGGTLAVWSAGDDQNFTRSLNQCGFEARTIMVRAESRAKGSRHVVWLARKP